MKHAPFRVTYDGPALATHEMDVRLLAPSLLAIGDVLEHANRVVNKGDAKVSVNLKGSFKTGSIGIDFSVVQGLYSQAIDLLTGKEIAAATALLALLGFSAKDGAEGLLQVIKWLRGRPIRRISMDHAKPIIYTDQDELAVELQVINLLRDYELRKALELTLQPLDGVQVTTFAVGTDTDVVETVSSGEREWFIAPPPEAVDLGETEYQKTVQIERIEFSEDNKWRFFDGTASFFATITDAEFLNRIAANEAAFTKGDTLSVIIIQHQRIEGDKLKSEYRISKILEHRKAMRQVQLPLE